MSILMVKHDDCYPAFKKKKKIAKLEQEKK